MNFSNHDYAELERQYSKTEVTEVNDIDEDAPTFDMAISATVPRGTIYDVEVNGGEYTWHQYDAPDGSKPPTSEEFNNAYKKLYREWSFNKQDILLFPASIIKLDAPLNRQQILDDALEFAKTAPNIHKSNINGYQADDFDCYDLAELILDVLPTPVTGRKVKYSEISMWVNINNASNFNMPHQHVGATGEEPIWSGVYYLQVPENSGDIIFYNPRGTDTVGRKHSALYQKGTAYKSITPVEGQILLFDPLLIHAVTTNNSDKERISIAFNVCGDVE
jgi:hypothetical protein